MLTTSTTALLKRVYIRAIYSFSFIQKPGTFRKKPDGRQRIFQQMVNRQGFKDYFFQKREGISPGLIDTINLIGEFSKDTKTIEKQLAKVTDLHMMDSSIMTPQSIFNLLVAINMDGREELLYKFRRLLFEYLLRRDLEEIELDRQSLHCFMECFIFFKGQMGMKKKQTFVTFHCLVIIQRHLHLVHPAYYISLLNVIREEKINNMVYLRFLKELHRFIQPILSEACFSSSLPPTLSQKGFFNALTEACKVCSCSPEMSQSLVTIFQKHYLKKTYNRDENYVQFILKIFISFPYRERDSNGQFFKSKFLDNLHVFLKEIDFLGNKEYYSCWSTYSSSVIYFLFYQHWMNLTFSQKEGLIYLQKSDLKEPPVLPSFFWQIYQQSPNSINNNPRIRDTIRDCYPDRFKRARQDNIKPFIQPTMETEIKIRMEIVLQKLGLTFQKEVNLSGRFFDFYLPEEGIVLELDGTIHFHSEFFENDDRTAYRNLHLVHAGYKLIVITIHEYNSNREVPQLMELFVSKLKLMREEHCVAVL